MSLELVFNELSMLPVAPDRESARRRGNLFVNTLRHALRKGIPTLRTQEAFKDSILAEGYSWWTWMNDPNIVREARLYLKSLVTRSPLFNGLQEIEEHAPYCEFFFADEKAVGLWVALQTNAIAISVDSDPVWHHSFLSLTIHELQEGGSIQTYTQPVHHASTPDHVDQHQAWIEEILKNSVTDGAELWAQHATCFPSLIFCYAVQEQMQSLPKHIVPSFFRGLLCLEHYCQAWQSGNFNKNALGCSSTVDGQTALGQFSKERTFILPEGESKTFSYHVKLGNHWRIYYDPYPGPGKICVGFVGRHLRTKRDH